MKSQKKNLNYFFAILLISAHLIKSLIIAWFPSLHELGIECQIEKQELNTIIVAENELHVWTDVRHHGSFFDKFPANWKTILFLNKNLQKIVDP